MKNGGHTLAQAQVSDDITLTSVGNWKITNSYEQ